MHGDNPTIPRLTEPPTKFGQPIMERVNGTFFYLPQVCLVLSKKLSQIPTSNEKFVDL
jgi:hypothetical protein